MPPTMPCGAFILFLNQCGLCLYFYLLLPYTVVEIAKDAYMHCRWHDFDLHKDTSTRPSTFILLFFFYIWHRRSQTYTYTYTHT